MFGNWNPDDWVIFHNAIIAFWEGSNPYLVGAIHLRFYNPMWTLLLITPFHILNFRYGIFVMSIAACITMLLISKKFKMNLWQAFCLASSPFLVCSLGIGNIEWLPWIGLLIPYPAIALIFFMIKPQATFGVILIMLWKECYEEIKQKNVMMFINKMVRISIPAFALLAIQVGMYGAYIPTPLARANFSLFPYSIPIGLGIMYYGLKNKNIRWGALASPLLSPYVSYISYLSMAIAFPGLSWIIGWIITIFRILYH